MDTHDEKKYRDARLSADWGWTEIWGWETIIWDFVFLRCMMQKREDTLRKCPLFFRCWRDAYFLSLFYLLSCPLLHFHSLQVVAGTIGAILLFNVLCKFGIALQNYIIFWMYTTFFISFLHLASQTPTKTDIDWCPFSLVPSNISS